jgi:hypothetical protein
MENRLWIFGDSFSTPYDGNGIGQWTLPYIQWKGYVPKTFGDLLGEELGLEVMHFAKGGNDNDSIFESVYQNAPQIKKGDVVIIGWSSTIRFRLSSINNKFITIIPQFKINESLSFISKSTIEEVLVNRSLPAYYNELYNRVHFLNWVFRDIKIIQWTPFWDTNKKLYGSYDILNITKETNNEVVDGHYSEKGHVQLKDKFLEFLNDDGLRERINSLCTHSTLI